MTGMLGFAASAWGGETKPVLFLDFDGSDAGTPPSGFSAALNGKGSPKADSVTLFDDLLAVNLDCPTAPDGGKSKL